jgi:hypothetical protein
MIKSILKPIEKVVTSRFNKSGLKEELAKHPDYVTKAKEIWDMIDKDFGISSTIDNILKLKVDKFDQVLISKFPELAKEEIKELKESIAGNLTQNKDLASNKVSILNELQKLNSKLQEENEKLKDQLSQFQSLFTPNSTTESNKTDTTANKDEK